jgi:hypothetical protein
MYRFNRKISNSALNKIDPELGGSPVKFMQFMDRIPDKESEEMILGKFIHKAILEPEKFNPVIYPKIEPGLKLVIDEFAKTEFSEKGVVEIARNLNYRSNYKDETLLTYILKNGWEYYELLVNNKDKDLISDESKILIDKAFDAYHSNPKIHEIVESGINTNELELLWNYGEFECKGIIDKLITYDSHTIVDLKVTSKPMNEYHRTFRQFKIYRQLAFYEKGLNALNMDSSRLHYIFVISINNNNAEAIPFAVDADYLYRGHYEIDELLKRIEFHHKNNNWSSQKEVITGELLTLQCPNFLKLEEQIKWYE